MYFLKKILGAIRILSTMRFRIWPFFRAPKPSRANVSYGKDQKQKFDYWRGSSKKGVLVFFHGGAFIRGKKFYSMRLREMHAAGYHVVAANYRLVNKENTVESCVLDAASVIVYLKEHANEYGIDPQKIAVAGSSAGGFLALALACNGNFLGKDINNEVVYAHVYNAPTTLDPELFKELTGVRDLTEFWLLWSRLFGIKEEAELENSNSLRLIEKYSPDRLCGKKLPPIYLNYHVKDAPGTPNAHFHNKAFGEHFKSIAEGLGNTVMMGVTYKK